MDRLDFDDTSYTIMIRHNTIDYTNIKKIS